MKQEQMINIHSKITTNGEKNNKFKMWYYFIDKLYIISNSPSLTYKHSSYHYTNFL